MGEGISAATAREQLFNALVPFMEHAGSHLPSVQVPEHARALVLVQAFPTMARIVLVGHDARVEVARLTGEDIPGEHRLASALEQFFAAGLSGMPPEVVEGVFIHAAKPGAGLVAVVDPALESVTCLLTASRVSLDRAEVLFSIPGWCQDAAAGDVRGN